MRRVVPILAAALLLAGCGGGSELPEGAGDHQPGSGCDEASFTSTMQHIFTESEDSLQGIEEFTCSGDWAVVTLALSGSDAGLGDQVIFMRDGDAWILKAPETVCGTVGADGVRPADAQVPADLWEQACASV